MKEGAAGFDDLYFRKLKTLQRQRALKATTRNYSDDRFIRKTHSHLYRCGQTNFDWDPRTWSKARVHVWSTCVLPSHKWRQAVHTLPSGMKLCALTQEELEAHVPGFGVKLHAAIQARIPSQGLRSLEHLLLSAGESGFNGTLTKNAHARDHEADGKDWGQAHAEGDASLLRRKLDCLEKMERKAGRANRVTPRSALRPGHEDSPMPSYTPSRSCKSRATQRKARFSRFHSPLTPRTRTTGKPVPNSIVATATLFSDLSLSPSSPAVAVLDLEPGSPQCRAPIDADCQVQTFQISGLTPSQPAARSIADPPPSVRRQFGRPAVSQTLRLLR